MIKVIYRPDERSVCIDGHAGAGPEGHDLVCAAVSALSYALEATCSEHPEYKGNVTRHDSTAHFFCRVNWRGRKALWAIVDGLKLLEYRYPQYIDFTERRDGHGSEE